MAQKEIEVILARHLASYLATPIFIVNPEGTLLYYNEPAEAILGVRYDETGEMPLAEWGTMFQPMDKQGQPLAPEQLPLTRSLQHRRPSAAEISICGLDGVMRHIEIFSFPLIGQGNRHLGALAIFWEAGQA